MEPSLQAEQFWKNLIAGGATASETIADYAKMPELKRDALVGQLFTRAEEYVDYLIAEEQKGNRPAFRGSKDEFLKLLDAVPALLTTPEARLSGIKRVESIDVQSRELTNIDILMKCDEIIEKLKRPQSSELDDLKVVRCGSLEELKEALGGEIPAEILEKIEKDGSAIILGVTIKKNQK
jgi:hypothetical protein